MSADSSKERPSGRIARRPQNPGKRLRIGSGKQKSATPSGPIKKKSSGTSDRSASRGGSGRSGKKTPSGRSSSGRQSRKQPDLSTRLRNAAKAPKQKTGRFPVPRPGSLGTRVTGPDGEDLPPEPLPSFQKGLPIAVKFAAFTAGVVALLMSLLGLVTYSAAEQEVDDQISRQGAAAVRLLGSAVDRSIFYDAAPDQWVKDQRKLEPNVGEYELKRRFEWEHNEARKYWNEKIPSITEGETDIIDARIYRDLSGNQMSPIATARGFTAYPEGRKLGTFEGAEAFEMDGLGNKYEGRVRYFVAPITGYADEHLGQAMIFLKAGKKDEVKNQLLTQVGLATGIGILIAVLLAILMASVLTRPLRELVKDMEIVAAGRLDHRTIPKSRDEVGVLANTFNKMTRSLETAQKAESEKKALERELSIATEIQTKLLPDRIPQIPGYDIFSYYLSAKEVGGDYYDFLIVDQNRLGVVVADVSGKGIPGSMVMTMARSLIRLASHRNPSPGDTLQKVNRILAKDMRRGMFVTSIYLVLDIHNKRLQVCSAGHNPLVHYSARKRACKLVNPSGIALGFDKGPIFESNLKEEIIQLEKGDRIVIYTDGVVEAMNERSEEFGDDRFYKLVQKTAEMESKDFVQTIITELEKHRGKAEQSDDITITTLRVVD